MARRGLGGIQVVAERRERGSILLTTNQAINEWDQVLGDPVVATTILDRLLHHGQVISIPDKSYRLREKRSAGLVGLTSQPDRNTN